MHQVEPFTIERVVGAAFGQFDEVFGGIDIDSDDLFGADQPQALDDIEADAAEAEHDGAVDATVRAKILEPLAV